MQTQLADFIKGTPDGDTAEQILRKCVHCGFCTATCPTYQLLGDELDGPRGRIYLIKQMLEGARVTHKTQLHLDRCLTCRACETTCPSGVAYGRLAEIGRRVADEQVPRSPLESIKRKAFRTILSHDSRFGPLLKAGQMVRAVLPVEMKKQVPEKRLAGVWPDSAHPRRMVTLGGCVQPSIGPQINAAAARVLDRLGITLRAPQTNRCCGAVSHHLGAHEEGLAVMRRNVDLWWDELEAGAEQIVITASACALQVKEYATLLAHDAQYADKASRVSASVKDLGEVLAAENLEPLGKPGESHRIAFHSPCTLQHGQRLAGVVEGVLAKLGFDLAVVADSHLCCGSAGTYSLLQPALSKQLRDNKLEALKNGGAELIATANIGCYTHLGAAAEIPVKHWIELLDS